MFFEGVYYNQMGTIFTHLLHLMALIFFRRSFLHFIVFRSSSIEALTLFKTCCSFTNTSCWLVTSNRVFSITSPTYLHCTSEFDRVLRRERTTVYTSGA